MIKLLSFALILILGCLLSCRNEKNTKPKDSKKFQLALKYAEENYAELQKVIEYYSKTPGDSLKLKAAYFIIENMIGKGYLSYTQENDKGLCSYDLFKIGNGIDSICTLKKQYEDSTASGEIIFTNPTFIEDIKLISSNEIIENIEYAFKAWRFPWAKELTFEEFKEFILVYRIDGEPLQGWRKSFFDNRKWIFDKIGNTTDRIKIAGIINDGLRRNYKYIHDKLAFFPGSLTIQQLKATKGGRCADLNMVAGYWLRAIGIPTATEFTQLWGNSNNGGHSWLSILDTSGKFVPMNAIYDNPVRDSLPFKGAHLAKAYRLKYEISPVFYKDKKTLVNINDITKEYLPVINYTMKPNIPTNKEVTIGILKGSYWKPLETEVIKQGDSVTFINIATNVLYAPITILNNGEIKTIGAPFFVYSSGKVQEIIEKKNELIDVYFDISRLVNKVYGKKYQVVYWDNKLQGWNSSGNIKILLENPKKTLKKKKKITIKFNNVVSNAIYRVIDLETLPNESTYGRPFIYNAELHQFIDY